MTDKWGVILVNLGTPDEPTAKGVRAFLAEFLSDKRVVEIPSLIWKPLLYGIILPLRSKRVAKLYQSIWTDRGSPLKVITEDQKDALQGVLSARHGDEAPEVTYAMTYGDNKFARQVETLKGRGSNKFLILPLYPQYSATTTGSVFDQYADLIRLQRDIPDIRIHKSYCQRQDYIDALAASVSRYWQDRSSPQKPRPQKLLFSFHGIPKRCIDLGDPYYDQCMYTATHVAVALDLPKGEWGVSFQSRLGKAEWLQPYTNKLLVEWAESGVESVDVICPAFASDCLETIEEIDGENRELFIRSGGKRYGFIPCLNADTEHIEMMANIVDEYVGFG